MFTLALGVNFLNFGGKEKKVSVKDRSIDNLDGDPGGIFSEFAGDVEVKEPRHGILGARL